MRKRVLLVDDDPDLRDILRCAGQTSEVLMDESSRWRKS